MNGWMDGWMGSQKEREKNANVISDSPYRWADPGKSEKTCITLRKAVPANSERGRRGPERLNRERERNEEREGDSMCEQGSSVHLLVYSCQYHFTNMCVCVCVCVCMYVCVFTNMCVCVCVMCV